jgi:hypothetical protein
MKIIIDHLTRMSSGFICAAGIDPETGQHIRPVLRGNQSFPVTKLAIHGGPLAISAIVDLKGAILTPVKPEIEDHLVFQLLMRRAGSLDDGDFWELLAQRSHTRFSTIFGSDLVHDGQSCTVTPGSGLASLGLLTPSQSPRISVRQRPNGRSGVRLSVTDGDVYCDLSVTDVRLYRDDNIGNWIPHLAVVQRVSHALQEGEPVVLAVGLTRPFSGSNGKPRHWLQINNIHFPDSSIFSSD